MKLMIGLLAAAILGTGGFAFAAGLDDSQQARTVSLPGVSTSDDTTTAATTTDDIVIGNARGDDDRQRRHLRAVRRGRARERSAVHGRCR